MFLWIFFLRSTLLSFIFKIPPFLSPEPTCCSWAGSLVAEHFAIAASYVAEMLVLVEARDTKKKKNVISQSEGLNHGGNGEKNQFKMIVLLLF